MRNLHSPHQLPYGQPPIDPAVNGLPVHMAYMQPLGQHSATAAVLAQGYVHGAPTEPQDNKGMPMRTVRAQQVC
jgi:hypothetical protein